MNFRLEYENNHWLDQVQKPGIVFPKENLKEITKEILSLLLLSPASHIIYLQRLHLIHVYCLEVT